jgi:hypothetical protein
MNIAFPAVFLFLLVAPGFLFRQFLQRSEVRTFDHTPFSAIVLQAISFAALFNFVVAVGASLFGGYEIEVGDAVRLLVGGASVTNELSNRFNWLNFHPLSAIGYFALTNFLAVASALGWRAIVEAYGLDRRGRCAANWVRGPAPWYYLFAGLDHPTGVDGAVIAAIVEFKEGSYLYTGLLLDYEVNEKGELDRLLLVQAQRRKLDNDRVYDSDAQRYADDPRRFYPIAGDVFVLRYDEIKTLNVSYLSLPSANERQVP